MTLENECDDEGEGGKKSVDLDGLDIVVIGLTRHDDESNDRDIRLIALEEVV